VLIRHKLSKIKLLVVQPENIFVYIKNKLRNYKKTKCLLKKIVLNIPPLKRFLYTKGVLFDDIINIGELNSALTPRQKNILTLLKENIK
jgi:L-cysteine desulfidase